VLAEKWPVLGRYHAAAWNGHSMIGAYACGLAEYLEVCEWEGFDRVACPSILKVVPLLPPTGAAHCRSRSIGSGAGV
jgi:hypothetical protein